jgi:hypothetical protein
MSWIHACVPSAIRGKSATTAPGAVFAVSRYPPSRRLPSKRFGWSSSGSVMPIQVDLEALASGRTTDDGPSNVGAGPYDGTMSWKETSVRELAEEIAACLAKGDSSAATRLAFRFVERYDKSDWETRVLITAELPQTTGSDRYDALVAGIVEFACASHGVVAPAWVNSAPFFLREWWFVSGVPSLHADALVHSPISLTRRGVFVTQGALEYA